MVIISCLEDREDLRHFSHKHPLTFILEAEEKRCKVCSEETHDEIYGCFSCKFFIHKSCGGWESDSHLPPEHPSHHHPLIRLHNSMCKICSQKLHGPMYGCRPCQFYIHESCSESQEEIDHPFHPAHKLILQERTLEYQSCNTCTESIQGLSYQCPPCSFYLHHDCASLRPSIRHQGHEHLLIFVYRTHDLHHSGMCACHSYINDPLFLRCLYCDINFHIDCNLQIPPIIEDHHLHQHPLRLNKEIHVEEDSDEAILRCNVCNQQRSSKHPFYYCAQCDFSAHTRCVVTEVIWHEKLGHVCRQGHTMFLHQKKWNDDIFCYACGKGIQGSVYRCDPCSVYLHELCAELPRVRYHPCHVHYLTLAEPLDKTKTECCACHKHCHAFTYTCYRSDCDINLDLDCALLYPEVINALVVEKFNKAGNEGSDRAEGERGMGERETINFLLHEHPLTFCENQAELLCPDCGIPFLGEYDHQRCRYQSPCYLHECAACQKAPSSSFYYCKLCWPVSPIFHKSCAELPQEIQISLHSYHSLHLAEGFNDWIYCNFCQTSAKARYRFCSHECRFQIHFNCAAQFIKNHEGREPTKNFFHEHPLTLLEVDDSEVCKICRNYIHGPSYACTPCEFYLHESCSELQLKVHSPSHPAHILELWPFVIYQMRPECIACDLRIKGFCYICAPCGIAFHLQCVSIKPTIKYKGHCHLLSLLEDIPCSGRCEACGCKIRDTFYLCCAECHSNFHVDCESREELPLTIGNPHHQHKSGTLVKDDYKLLCCVVCKGDGNCDSASFFYSCAECDHYSIHLQCLVTEVHSNKSKVSHFSHRHDLTLCEKEDILCSACNKVIQGTAYGCNPCETYLHKLCKELPLKVKHPFHSHRLTVSSFSLSHENQCSACYKYCEGFTYRCEECDFNLDLDCVLLQPSVKYEGIEDMHKLTLFQKLYGNTECKACRSARDIPYLRCVKCNFNIHLQCAPLPETIKHWSHPRHSLTARDTHIDDNYDAQICDICEETGRNPAEFCYNCAECDFIAELKCVTTEVFDHLKGEGRDVPLKFLKEKALTLREIRDCSTEEEKMGIKSIKQKIKEDLATISDSESECKVVLSENPPYSDVTFTHFIVWFFCNWREKLRHRATMYSVDYEDIVVHVGDNMITQKLAPVLESLIKKHGDFTAKCSFKSSKPVLLAKFCEVVLSMCNTKIINIRGRLMTKWWRNLKLVQRAGFRIEFALNHLQKIAHALVRDDLQKYEESAAIKVVREMAGVSQEIDKLTAELQKRKERKWEMASHSDVYRLEAERLDELLEFGMKRADTGFL